VNPHRLVAAVRWLHHDLDADLLAHDIGTQVGNRVDKRAETVFTQGMTTSTHHMSYCDNPAGHAGVCKSVEDRRPSAAFSAVTDALGLRTVTINTEQAKAAVLALLTVVAGTDVEDCNTWHGGLGTDLCEFCEALVILRAAAGYTPTDWVRP
jgi:hypothetical protein